MALNPNEDTEFNDALRKHGILPPKTPPPRTPSPPDSPTLEDLLEDFTPSELRERADEAQDDDEARAIEAYRKHRIAEMLRESRTARFGRVYPIGRDDYTREVTEASKIDEEREGMEGNGTGVVCFLYKDGHALSEVAFGHIRTLAARHPRTKFVSIVGDKCIPNYPDRLLPTLFIYRKGEIVNQQVAWGASKPHTIDELEALLFSTGAAIPNERPLPRGRADEDDDFGDDDISRPGIVKTTNRVSKSTRQSSSKDESDDSDFDL